MRAVIRVNALPGSERVLAIASFSQSNARRENRISKRACFDATPKPTRETRVLNGHYRSLGARFRIPSLVAPTGMRFQSLLDYDYEQQHKNVTHLRIMMR